MSKLHTGDKVVIGMMSPKLLHQLNGTFVELVARNEDGVWMVDSPVERFWVEEKFLFPDAPSGRAKAVGLKSLKQVSDLTGTSINTLGNWHRDKPELFRIVLLGCIAELGA